MSTSISLVAFFAGLVSFLSPCIIPMITVYFSLITGMSMEQLTSAKKKTATQLHIIINTLLFIAAFTLVFTVAGGTAGQAAKFLNKNIKIFNILGGIMVILLALKMLGVFKAVTLKSRRLENLFNTDKFTSARYLTTFLVGIFFAIACSHCIGPVLYSMLIFAGSTGSVHQGMFTMFSFSMGLAVPYLVVGLTLEKSAKLLQKVSKYQKSISYSVGAILLFFGILMVFNRYTLLVELLYKVIPIRAPIGM
ncbi:MAG: cytochrome c-type biosis protein [Petroclostridium sp.]|jgi:cytochrome c-type biogenesis protein|uniref:cytochrome c biogenesis CcdA family protein n=1 Tax=Petroclostridium xylanilyticum TaxID=1792311 RepID=UPI0018E2A811|nr:cytochrome c biogenesis protein CcdA [Petroclostridium xylanilyticum]MBZ4646999.1 cytochrome biosis protein [Clostridia bacterium]MDK2809449.1 cytochrome c-type biosis protein [Petroclostridium sp.]